MGFTRLCVENRPIRHVERILPSTPKHEVELPFFWFDVFFEYDGEADKTNEMDRRNALQPLDGREGGRTLFFDRRPGLCRLGLFTSSFSWVAAGCKSLLSLSATHARDRVAERLLRANEMGGGKNDLGSSHREQDIFWRKETWLRRQ